MLTRFLLLAPFVAALLMGLSASPARAEPPTLAQRSQAAAKVAQSADNACAAIRPFYWEIGDSRGAQASGSVDKPGGHDPVTAGSEMNIASASKWLYGAYVAQKRAGRPTPEDIKHLTFRSGYSHFSICTRRQTAAACQAFMRNGRHDDATDGRFEYGGGHMQQHAVLMGLGALDNEGLAHELQTQLGADVGLSYSQPQLAGGGVSTAADYARFLRKLMSGELMLGRQLGEHAVCTNRLRCPAEAVNTPIPMDEAWHYALGHWVEDDPKVGDGAFSSPGAFGFYPWIDATRQTYGIVARRGGFGSAKGSVDCGRAIRRAWMAPPAP